MIAVFRSFSNASLRTKIIVLFLLLIAAPLGVQSAITFNNFSNVLNKQAVGYTEQIIKQMNTELENSLRDDMQKFALMVLYNQELLNILEKHGGASGFLRIPSVVEQQRIFQYIAGYEFYRSYIKGVQIITNQGYIFTNAPPNDIHRFLVPELENWISRVEEARGRWVILPRHIPHYWLNPSPDGYVSIASQIYSPGSVEPFGIIKIDFTDELFTRLSENYEDIGTLLIVNRNNELIYLKEGEAGSSATLLSRWLPNRDSVFEMTINGRDYLTIVGYSEFTGLKIISYIPIDTLLSATKPLLHSTILFAMLCLTVGGGLALASSYKLTRPLVQLRKKMNLVRHGKLRQTVQVASHDELGHLSQEFNLMTEEINRLVNEVYLLSIKEKEAQLSALQSQINPHFIYNTLESINMMAIQANDYPVSDTVHALGRLLRYTVDKYDRLVPLSEELDFIQAYMMIQNVRFGSRLRLILEVDGEVDQVMVPKLLLQPLVENAIEHGFNNMAEEGRIWVSVVRFEEELLLTVRDNGKGLNEEEIARLRHALQSPMPQEMREQPKGLALRNIQERLALIYGAQYAIDIDGTPGHGASFTITIPIQGAEQDENHDC